MLIAANIDFRSSLIVNSLQLFINISLLTSSPNFLIDLMKQLEF